MVTLLWCIVGPLGVAGLGWLIQRQAGGGRFPSLWLAYWSVWGAALAFVGLVLWRVLALAFDALGSWESAPAVGYAGQGAARVQLFLVAMVCCGGVGTSLAAWLWLGPWRAMPRWAWWQWGFPLLGLVVGTYLMVFVGPSSPGGRFTRQFWVHYGYWAEFRGGALTELRAINSPVHRNYRPAIMLMAQLPDLEAIDFRANVDLTDDDLRYLARLPKLRKLNLISCRRITDAGIEHLRGHPALEELDLKGTAVTDACIPALRSMPNLRLLSASSGNPQFSGYDAIYNELRSRPPVHP